MREKHFLQFIQDDECPAEALEHMNKKAYQQLGSVYAEKYATRKIEYLFRDKKNDQYFRWHSRDIEPKSRFDFIGTIHKFEL